MRKSILAFLLWLQRQIDPKICALYFIVRAEEGTVYKGIKMATSIQVSSQVVLHVQAEDKPGNVTQLQPGTVPAWSSSDTTLGNVTASADGMSALAVSGSKPGTFTVTATAEGFSTTMDISIAAGPVDHLTISADTPTPITAPAA